MPEDCSTCSSWTKWRLQAAVRQGASGVVADYARLASDWGFDLSCVEADVTVWHGELDPLIPADHARALGTRLPGARLRTLAGSGHFLPLTDAQGILEDLLAQ